MGNYTSLALSILYCVFDHHSLNLLSLSHFLTLFLCIIAYFPLGYELNNLENKCAQPC